MTFTLRVMDRPALERKSHLAAAWGRFEPRVFGGGLREGAIYQLEGSRLSRSQVEQLAKLLLSDPVTQVYDIAEKAFPSSGGRTATVWLCPGVADPVADTLLWAARDVGVEDLTTARSGRWYHFEGVADSSRVERFCRAHVMNPLIHTLAVR